MARFKGKYAKYESIDEDARFTEQASPQSHREDVAVDVELLGPSLADEYVRLLGDSPVTSMAEAEYATSPKAIDAHSTEQTEPIDHDPR